MSDEITAGQFQEADGVDDWRVLAFGACTFYRTGSFAVGVQLVNAIAELAEEADHHPDIDLRYRGVTVRLFSHDVLDLSERDLALAGQISAAARELDIPADPSAVQDLDFTIDHVGPDVLPFWKAVLGYEQVSDEDLIDPHLRWPSIWFQEKARKHPDHNRIHVDLWVPHDQAETRVAAALAAGGRLLGDRSPTYWPLADPEGNVVDVATWQGRD